MVGRVGIRTGDVGLFYGDYRVPLVALIIPGCYRDFGLTDKNLEGSLSTYNRKLGCWAAYSENIVLFR